MNWKSITRKARNKYIINRYTNQSILWTKSLQLEEDVAHEFQLEGCMTDCKCNSPADLWHSCQDQTFCTADPSTALSPTFPTYISHCQSLNSGSCSWFMYSIVLCFTCSYSKTTVQSRYMKIHHLHLTSQIHKSTQNLTIKKCGCLTVVKWRDTSSMFCRLITDNFPIIQKGSRCEKSAQPRVYSQTKKWNL